MKDDVVLLSHYDLDGAGCSVLADHIWNVVDRKHQGYGKIRKSLGYLIGEYYGKVGTIVIADLKMERADLELALFAFPRVIYYDHHESSADFEDMTLVRSDRQFQFNFSTDYCSTALMWMDGVKNWGAERTPALDAFMNAVNTYDLWKTDAKRWEQGVMLNDMFWHLHMDDFRRRFANGLTGFSEDERDWHAQLMNQRKYVIENAIIEEMDSGSKVVVLQEQKGINYVSDYIDGDLYYIISPEWSTQNVSVRYKPASEDDPFNVNDQLGLLANNHPKLIQSAGGHSAAGGITFADNMSLNDIVDFLFENDPLVRGLNSE